MLCTLTPYDGSKCLQHHIFLLNPTRVYYCSFFTLIHIKHVFPFYSCYCISYNNTLESLLNEINFFHSMPNCNVTLIGNPYLLFFKSVNYTKLVIYCDLDYSNLLRNCTIPFCCGITVKRNYTRKLLFYNILPFSIHSSHAEET